MLRARQQIVDNVRKVAGIPAIFRIIGDSLTETCNVSEIPVTHILNPIFNWTFIKRIYILPVTIPAIRLFHKEDIIGCQCVKVFSPKLLPLVSLILK